MNRTLALFDFDGTITIEDSANKFYRYIYHSFIKYLFKNYFCCLRLLILYNLRMIGYLPLKQKRLKVHTMGIGDAKLKTLSNEFKNEVLGQLLLPKAVERIKWHLEQGHSVWVVSASFDFILKEWANENGVNLLTNLTKEVTNYRMMINDDVNFNGKLKVIKENIKLEYFSEIYAYGDSPGDEMMLKIATHPHYKYFSS